jgi:hypothetical protein
MCEVLGIIMSIYLLFVVIAVVSLYVKARGY